MKKITLILIAAVLFACDKEKKPDPEPIPEMELQEGYIIGFNQCIRPSFVIVTNDYKDTLVTFDNLDTIYVFPEYLFYYFREDFRFPDSVLNKYKIFLNYTYLTEEEKYPVVCTADIYYFNYLEIVRNRQIKINYATKYPIKSVKIK